MVQIWLWYFTDDWLGYVQIRHITLDDLRQRWFHKFGKGFPNKS